MKNTNSHYCLFCFRDSQCGKMKKCRYFLSVMLHYIVECLTFQKSSHICSHATYITHMGSRKSHTKNERGHSNLTRPHGLQSLGGHRLGPEPQKTLKSTSEKNLFDLFLHVKRKSEVRLYFPFHFKRVYPKMYLYSSRRGWDVALILEWKVQSA